MIQVGTSMGSAAFLEGDRKARKGNSGAKKRLKPSSEKDISEMNWYPV